MRLLTAPPFFEWCEMVIVWALLVLVSFDACLVFSALARAARVDDLAGER